MTAPSALCIDETLWPIVVIIPQGEISREAVGRYMIDIDRLLLRKQPQVYVFDGQQPYPFSMVACAEFAAAFRARRAILAQYCVGAGVVFSNPLYAVAFAAYQKLYSSTYPTVRFSDMEAALAWGRERLLFCGQVQPGHG